MSFTLFVIGNIASGKSTACRYLKELGAHHIDLDVIAKGLYVPGSALVESMAEEFGWDVLDADGAVKFPVLAERAFVDREHIDRLNQLVHPVLLGYLSNILLPVPCCSLVVPSPKLMVVEISAPAAFMSAFGLADEVMSITAPLEIRRERAIARGMSAGDFDARAALQPTEDELIVMSNVSIDNTAGDDTLFKALDRWADERGVHLNDGD